MKGKQREITALTIILLALSVANEIGDVQTIQATDYIFSVFYDTTNATLSYPSVFNDNLWITTCRSDNSLRKYDLKTEILLQQTNLSKLDHRTDEAFAAYVHNGLVYVPMIGYQSNNTVLTIYNETTLDEVFNLNKTSNIINSFTTTVYDPIHNRLLFGTGYSRNSTIGIWAVDPAQSTNASAYYLIEIGTGSGGGGWELTPTTFDSKVYTVQMDNGAGLNGIVTTNIYSSSDLSTWTLEYSANGYNHGPGAYFPHISASSDYIAVGLLKGIRYGTSTYTYVYKSAKGQWLELNTGQPETIAEDQPMVQAIDGTSLFLIEVSARQYLQNSISPKFYLFDASVGTVQPMFSTKDHGFNDRSLGIDKNMSVIYLQNGENKGTYHSQVLRIPFDIILTDK